MKGSSSSQCCLPFEGLRVSIMENTYSPRPFKREQMDLDFKSTLPCALSNRESGRAAICTGPQVPLPLCHLSLQPPQQNGPGLTLGSKCVGANMAFLLISHGTLVRCSTSKALDFSPVEQDNNIPYFIGLCERE